MLMERPEVWVPGQGGGAPSLPHLQVTDSGAWLVGAVTPWLAPVPMRPSSPTAAAAVPLGGAHPDILGGERSCAVSVPWPSCLGSGEGDIVSAYVQLWPPLSPRSAGGPRKGYMGHLTRVANALVQNTEKGPNAEQLGQLLKGEAGACQMVG